MIIIKKPTKNFLIEDVIARDLYTVYKEEKQEYPLLLAVLLLFALIPSIFALASIKSIVFCILVILPFATPLIVYLVRFFLLFTEPKKIERGQYDVTVKRLIRKRAIGGQYTTYLLSFSGFRAKQVTYNDYHYASDNDEYYLVYYKNSKNIRLFYPLRTHTLKESPSFKVK